MSEVKVNKLSPRSGTTVTIGDSGDTINLVGTVQNNGSPLPGDISSVVAGTGLSGGGSTGDVTLDLDLNELTTSTSDADGDFFAVVDAANAQKKLTKGNINISGFNNDSGFIDGSSLNAGNLSSGTVPSARLSGAYTGITQVGTLTGLTTGAITSTGDFTFNVADGMSINTKESLNINIDTDDNDSSRTFIVTSGSGGTSEKLIQANEDGGVKLYYDNSEKITTTSSGVDVTGNLTATGNLTSNGIDDNATSTAITIDSSGNIGIGNTNPADFSGAGGQNLVVGSGSGGEGITIYSSTTADGVIGFADGSSGTDDYRGFLIYKHNGDAFQFGTSSTERMRLNSTGLGIGTSSPSEKLHVVGDILATGGDFKSDANNYLGFSNDTFARFVINDSEKMRILSSGNVGIGTSSPDTRLHLQLGSSGATGNTYSTAILESNNPFNVLQFLSPNTANQQIRFGDPQLNGAGIIQYAHNGNFMSFYTSDAEAMRIASDGDVGIGTSSPLYPLHVNGSALFSGTIIATGGSDGSDRRASITHDGTNMLIKASGNSTNRGFSFHRSGDGSADEVLNISTSGHVTPGFNDAQDLGSTSKVWRNIYTGDLHLSNEAKDEGNAVDGTKGNWTIQEGAEDLYILNNKTGKKFKFKLEEIS